MKIPSQLASTPDLEASLSDLATVLKRLHEESDSLTASITAFEKRLVDMKPGIEIWLSPLCRYHGFPGTDYARGAQLGFWKEGRTWGLWVRQGRFKKAEGERWDLDPDLPPDEEMTYSRLVDASREDRMAAVEQFPLLVLTLKAAAVERLNALSVVNAKQRLR